ncbi:MAG TPA: serine hydrolase, partial [Cytophagales bacterium]|nr:serine hydrolase [Cytophagales bacterium]
SPLWVAKHGVSSINYQHEVDNLVYQGYRPRCLNAFASGTSAKFNYFWVNTNYSAADMAKIDNAVNNYRTAQNVNGVSLAITKNGRLVFAKGYGYANPSTGEILSPNHSLRIMSISKSATSVGILTLVQAGKLSLNQLVFGPNGILGTKYPTPVGKEKLNSIRVRHLLTHTSGLRTCNGEAVFWDQTKTPDNAMSVLLASPTLIKNDAGVVYEYSNTGFFILERIIEQVSGLKYESYIRTNVLAKSGIGSTMYVGQASGNIKAGESTYNPMHNMNLQLWAGFGGWVARPIDLLKFLNRVDGQATPSDIITASTHTTMTTGTTQNPNYALGWVVSGSLQNHNGCFGGSSSFLVERGNGISYAIILNSTPTNGDCSGGLKNALDVALSQVVAFPSYNLFDNIGPGARVEESFAQDDASQNDVAEDANLVTVYPKPSVDGLIHFNNAAIIKSVTVIDAMGVTERHAGAIAELKTNLKGLLILKIETEQGTVTDKVIVE